MHYHHDTIYSEELKKISLLLQHESTQMSVKSISEHLRVNNNHLIKMNEKIRKSLPDGYDYNPWGIQFQIDTHEKGRHSIARVAAFPATDLHSSCTEKIWIISSLYTNH